MVRRARPQGRARGIKSRATPSRPRPQGRARGIKSPACAAQARSSANRLLRSGRPAVVAVSLPCRHVKKYPEHKRERFLSDDEYRRLGAALRDAEREGFASPAAIAAIRLLMLTGCRSGEILSLRWEPGPPSSIRVRPGRTATSRASMRGFAASAWTQNFLHPQGSPGSHRSLAAPLQYHPPTRQSGIPAADPGNDRHAKPAARLRSNPPATQLGGETVNVLTFKLDKSPGAGQRCLRKSVAVPVKRRTSRPRPSHAPGMARGSGSPNSSARGGVGSPNGPVMAGA